MAMQSSQTMEKPLPEGWRWVKLGEVTEINPRRPRDLERLGDAPTTFVPMTAVDDLKGEIARPETKLFKEVRSGYTYFAEGDVLFAKITPCMQNGKHAIAKNLIDNIGFGSTEFHVIRPSNQIYADWIHLFIRQPRVLSEAKRHFSGAVGQQRVPENFLASIEIPIPSLPEQQRIAALLREQMQAVNEARQAAEAQLKAAEQLQAAYLRNVFDNPEAKQWPRKKLGDYVATYRNGFGRRPKGIESGPIVLRLADVSSGYINLGNPRRVETSSNDKVLYRIKKGDLLFVRVNGSSSLIGRCVLVDIECSDVIYNDHLIRVQLKEGLLPEFLKEVSYFPEVRNAIVEGASTSAGQLTINQSILSSLLIPLPSLKKQEFLLEKIKSKHEDSIILCENLKDQLTAINQLPAALLRQAFSGAL